MLIKLPLSVVFCLSLSSSVLADLHTYRDEAEFVNALTSFSFESFEDLADTSPSANTVSTQHFEVTPFVGELQVRSSPTGGHRATHGDKYIAAGFVDNGSFFLSFDLLTNANAFGITVTDYGDLRSGELLLRTDRGEASDGIVIASTPLENGNELFFGFTQTEQFSSVFLYQTNIGDGIGFDGVYVQSVPEPSYLLFPLALMALVSLQRVRRGMKACTPLTAADEIQNTSR